MRIILCPEDRGHPEGGSSLDGPHGVEGGPGGAGVAAGGPASGSALGTLEKGFPSLVVAPVDCGGPCPPCVETALKLSSDCSLFRIDPLRPLDEQVDEVHRQIFRVVVHAGRVEHVGNKVAHCGNQRRMQRPVASP